MIAVVTGASRGLGLALATLLNKEGYDHLILPSRSPADPLEEWWVPLDLGNPLALDTFVHQHQRLTVDLLVNNASYCQPLLPVERLPRTLLTLTLQINFIAPVRLMKWTLPKMKAQGKGIIVNICSYCGRRGRQDLSAYCASKFALRGFTECVAKELEGTGVRCFSVSPGGINTKMRSDLFGEEDASRQQTPEFVAQKIVDAVTGRLHVPNGADLVIRQGEVRVVTPQG